MLEQMVEEWRPVVEFPGWYDVSNFGRVRRVKPGKGTKPMKVLRSIPAAHRPNGDSPYLGVNLCIQGKSFPRLIHCLVAAAFIGPRPVAAQVNHKDGNKHNNLSTNLEYMTRKENMEHASANGLVAYGERHGQCKYPDSVISAVRAARRETGASHSRLSKQFGIPAAYVGQILANQVRKEEAMSR